jgi:adenylyltransferase/sulfurtransferase
VRSLNGTTSSPKHAKTARLEPVRWLSLASSLQPKHSSHALTLVSQVGAFSSLYSGKPASVLEFCVLECGVILPMPLPEYKQLVDEAKREIKEIDPAELKRMQQSQQNFTLIDVREPDEVAQGAIDGSVALPRGQLEHKIDTITTDKERPIVCYCGGGGRSALAAQSLKKMGFKNVMSLAGGYKKWSGS